MSTKRPVFKTKQLSMRLDLAIPGDVKAIGPIVDKVMVIVTDLGCAEGSEFEVELALREALANAVVHGCKSDPGKSVQFVVACDHEQGMMIIVRDPGEGFDPAEIPSPVKGECLFEAHGRGIYLINQLMDEVEIDRGGTEIRMRKS